MFGSYGISSKQAYKLSFILVGKTQIKHLPDHPDIVLYSLCANSLQQQHSSIINVFPNINSSRLNHNSPINPLKITVRVFCFPHVTFTLFDDILENQFPLNPIPLNLLRLLSPYFIRLIAEIIHISLLLCIVPHSMKYS